MKFVSSEQRAGKQKAAFQAPVSYVESAYNTEVTTQDTIDEVYGIVSRNLGKQYKNWFYL